MSESRKELNKKFDEFFLKTQGMPYESLTQKEKEEFDKIREEDEYLNHLEEERRNEHLYYDFEDIHDYFGEEEV